MTARQETWLKVVLALAVPAVMGAVAIGAARYELSSKADRAEVKALEVEVQRKAGADTVVNVLRRLDERTQRIERYICRKRPDDLGC